MARARRVRRPNGSEELPVRSIRCEDQAWNKAQRRASFEGVTMSRAVALLIQSYGDGQVNLPKVGVIYDNPVQEVAQ